MKYACLAIVAVIVIAELLPFWLKFIGVVALCIGYVVLDESKEEGSR